MNFNDMHRWQRDTPQLSMFQQRLEFDFCEVKCSSNPFRNLNWKLGEGAFLANMYFLPWTLLTDAQSLFELNWIQPYPPPWLSKKIPDTPTKTGWSRAQFEKGQPTPCKPRIALRHTKGWCTWSSPTPGRPPAPDPGPAPDQPQHGSPRYCDSRWDCRVWERD